MSAHKCVCCTGSVDGQPSVVDIEPCDSEPCHLKKGQNYSITVTFVSAVESLKSMAVVHGIIAGVPIPFHITNSDGCMSGINCPIHAKDQYKYTATLPVRVEYPSIKVTVEWELRDDAKKDLFCIEFPIQIES